MLRMVLFDLDDTLYGAETGLWPAIGQRINLYMIERLGLVPDVARTLRQHYLETFGTTLNGLRHDYNIDADDYLAFVHDLPLDRYLEPNPALNQMLARLPMRKVIFTNADAPHARRVIARLGISEHFERIIDVHALNFCNKPDPRAYAQAMALTGAEPAECVFVDDAVRNLLPAHEIGMVAVRISPAGGAAPAGVDYQIASILDLEPLLATIDPGLAARPQPFALHSPAEP